MQGVGEMDSPKDAIAIMPTFEEVHGVYKVPSIDWNSYTEHTKSVVDKVVKELLTYYYFYWIIRIEIASLWRIY